MTLSQTDSIITGKRHIPFNTTIITAKGSSIVALYWPFDELAIILALIAFMVLGAFKSLLATENIISLLLLLKIFLGGFLLFNLFFSLFSPLFILYHHHHLLLLLLLLHHHHHHHRHH